MDAMPEEAAQTRKRLHFKNPPIIEAVIAFWVAPLPDSVIPKFRDLVGAMKELGYEKSFPVTVHQLQFKIEPGKGTSSSDTADSPIGLKFTSDDNLHAVQFNKTGFIFSRLGQYQTWEQFRDEGKKLWKIYQAIANEFSIVRASVRFINKLFIPTNAKIEEYIAALPMVPDHIAPVITEMLMHFVSPIANPPGIFVHNQVLLPPEKEGLATVLFDNDFQFQVDGKSSDEIWEMLETVRDIKDHYFVELTTKKMRATFDA